MLITRLPTHSLSRAFDSKKKTRKNEEIKEQEEEKAKEKKNTWTICFCFFVVKNKSNTYHVSVSNVSLQTFVFWFLVEKEAFCYGGNFAFLHRMRQVYICELFIICNLFLTSIQLPVIISNASQ